MKKGITHSMRRGNDMSSFRRTMIRLFLVFSILVASINAFAVGEDWIGQTAVATKTVILSDSPPKGLLCTEGRQIDSITKGERVRVKSYIKANCTFGPQLDFIEVERLTAGLAPDKRVGFVPVLDQGGAPFFQKQ